MEEYREIYYHLANATERAIRLLIKAQQECEELFLSVPETAETLENPPVSKPEYKPR